MTTIVYDHKTKQIAVDGLCVTNDFISSTNYRKFKRVGEQLWFFCGSVCDVDYLIENGENGKLKRDYEPECSAFVVEDGKVFYVTRSETRIHKEELQMSHAIGSGQQFALAALDNGNDIEGSLLYASKRDMYTGGKFWLYNIQSKKMECRNYIIHMGELVEEEI